MYDWKITLKKLAWGAGPGILLTVATAVYEYLIKTGEEGGTINWEALGAAVVTGIVLGVKNYRAHGGKPPKLNGPPYSALSMLLFVGLGCATFSGCATTHQAVKTMEGDTFSQTAFSTLGKQNSEQDIAAKFGNSEITVGGSTEQDSTAMVPMIQALVGALVQQQQSGGVDTPERGRLEALEAQIAALRRIIESLRPVDKKW